MIIRRESKAGANDLNVVYRPCTIDELLGNETNKRIIKKSLDSGKVPHTWLFTGYPGCGKTTAARIIALGLNCKINGVSSTPCLECSSCRSILDGNSIDVKEINVGQSGGKDYVDSIVRDLSSSPFNSNVKVLIFDEAHELTNAAKDLLLKPLENGYDHVYFIFCTNQPEKLRSKKKDAGEAFLDRCNILNFNRISTDLITELLLNICEFEGVNYNVDVLKFLSEESVGVPRNAVVWLSQVITENSWTISVAKEICGVLVEENDPQIIDLCRSLNDGKFKKAVTIFTGMRNVNMESVRITVTGYFVGCLKRSKKVPEARKYSAIVDVLSTPIYEVGRLAGYKWYNYMFKVTDIINLVSGGR